MNKGIKCPACGRNIFLGACLEKDLKKSISLCNDEVFSTKLECLCGWKDDAQIRYVVSNGRIALKEVERFELSKKQVLYGKKYPYVKVRNLGSYFPILESDTPNDIRAFLKIRPRRGILNCPEKFYSILNDLITGNNLQPCIIVKTCDCLRRIDAPWRTYFIEDGEFIVCEPAYEVITPYEVLKTNYSLNELYNAIINTNISRDINFDELGWVNDLANELIHILKQNKK